MSSSMILFAQAEVPVAAEAVESVPADGGEAAAATAAAPAARQNGLGMMVPMLVLFGIFYLMFVRPQSRKEKERRKLIDELRAGAKVIFCHGLVGTIVEANERTFRIRTVEGEVECLRGAVDGLYQEPDSAAAAK